MPAPPNPQRGMADGREGVENSEAYDSSHEGARRIQYRITLDQAQQLLTALRPSIEPNGTVKEISDGNASALYELIKVILNNVYDKAFKDNTASNNGACTNRELVKPGHVVYGAICERLGNEAIPVTEDSRISTPRGTFYQKTYPQVVWEVGKHGCTTFIAGTKQGVGLTEMQVTKNPKLLQQSLRLLRGGEEEDTKWLPGEGKSIIIEGGSDSIVKSSSRLYFKLGFLQFKDISGQTNAKVAHKSVETFIDWAVKNFYDSIIEFGAAQGFEVSGMSVKIKETKVKVAQPKKEMAGFEKPSLDHMDAPSPYKDRPTPSRRTSNPMPSVPNYGCLELSATTDSTQSKGVRFGKPREHVSAMRSLFAGTGLDTSPAKRKAEQQDQKHSGNVATAGDNKTAKLGCDDPGSRDVGQPEGDNDSSGNSERAPKRQRRGYAQDP